MARLAQVLLFCIIPGLISAQVSSVTQVFLPFADEQPLDASIIGQDGDVKTMVIDCVPGTPSDECGFPEPFTLTAGPSTLHYSASGIYQKLGQLDCKITATTEADCTAVAGVYPTDVSLTDSSDEDLTVAATSSTTDSATLTGTDMVWVDVTITAGAVSQVTTSAPVTSASANGGASSTTIPAAKTTMSVSATGTTATTSNAAAMVGVSKIAHKRLVSGLLAGLMALL